MAKISAGKITFESISFDLRNLIESILRPHQLVNTKRLHLSSRVDDAVPQYLIGGTCAFGPLFFFSFVMLTCVLCWTMFRSDAFSARYAALCLRLVHSWSNDCDVFLVFAPILVLTNLLTVRLDCPARYSFLPLMSCVV